MKRVFWKKNASRVKSSFQLNLLLNHIQTKKVEKLSMYPLLLVYKTDVKKGYLTVSLFGLLALNSALSVILYVHP